MEGYQSDVRLMTTTQSREPSQGVRLSPMPKVIVSSGFLLLKIHPALVRSLPEDFPNDNDTQMDYRQPLGP